ncbi:preprotein translocase subunit SecA [Patescibacteria group bacterium]|nr:preprotein translocase subunit SecA [Patescibacteria group bacterium]
MGIFNKMFGDANNKYIKGLQPIIEKINSFEDSFQNFQEEDFKKKTQEFKERIKLAPTEGGDILPEVFALVREAAKRTLNQRHYDVQLISGIILHQGKIAEMKTGEGKTLSATLAVYLNALEGKGVHVVTVNDYLSRRDAIWMGQIYDLLGLTTGCLNHEQSFLYDSEFKKPEEDEIRDRLGSFKVIEDFLKPVSRKEAYSADVTYGTNNEYGFDYLRDNMVYTLEDRVQRGQHYAVIDEVDSILIDESRTPLIISVPGDESTDKYYLFFKLVDRLNKEEDYVLEERTKSVTFTEEGQNKIVRQLGDDPWSENDISTTHQLESALKAKTYFERDKNYVVKDGQIIIVDEFTGRLMPGRRWSSGIHQAVEAKEGVEVQKESQTLATVTFQNYFRLYNKLSGMTGTAMTSAEEFDKVYKLDSIVVPTNKILIRKEMPDRIYKTLNGKFQAVVEEIKERHTKGQPVLVGTVSIEKNEYLGKLLEREGVPHKILNAKHHEQEGEIIAQSGHLGAVTIATNMAGRGVDIILGGNPCDKEEQKKVLEVGGLHVIGTERHESRRIDNQLRGRAGRQGDPGSSQFFVSLEDDLMRIFGGDRIKDLMDKMKIPEDQPIEAGLVSKAIESSQSKVEGMNFDARNHVLEYDDVMNKHREIFYAKRVEFMKGVDILGLLKRAGFSEEEYLERKRKLGEENAKQIEKFIPLKVLDAFWIEHLENMGHLRDSVGLRAYGQQDPLIEYKREGHGMFKALLADIEKSIANAIMKADVKVNVNEKGRGPSSTQKQNKRVGRNDPCSCGSGKKFKKCCGKEA